MARLLAMSSYVALADLKNRLSEVIDRIHREHGRVVITRHGQPTAVLLSLEDLESLEETLEILSDPQLTAAIAEAEADVAAGRVVPMTKEEALAAARRP
jgi:antitoxin YefM